MSSAHSAMSIGSEGNTDPVTSEAREELKADLDQALELLGELKRPQEALEDLNSNIRAMYAKLSVYKMEDVVYFWKEISAVTLSAVWQEIVEEQKTPEDRKKVTDVLECLQSLGIRLINRYDLQLHNPDVQVKFREGKPTVVLAWRTKNDSGNVTIASTRYIPFASTNIKRVTLASTMAFIDKCKPSADQLRQYLSNVNTWRKQIDERSSIASRVKTVYEGVESHLKFVLSATASTSFQIPCDDRETSDVDDAVTHLPEHLCKDIARCVDDHLVPAFHLLWSSTTRTQHESNSNIVVVNLVRQWRQSKNLISPFSEYKPGGNPASMKEFWALVRLMSGWKHFGSLLSSERKSFEQLISKGEDKTSIRQNILKGLQIIRQVVSQLSGMSLKIAGFGDPDIDFYSLAYTASAASHAGHDNLRSLEGSSLEPRYDTTIILDPASNYETFSKNMQSFLFERLTYLTDTDGSKLESLASQIDALQAQVDSGEMTVVQREQVLEFLAAAGAVVENLKTKGALDRKASKKSKRSNASSAESSRFVMSVQKSVSLRALLKRPAPHSQNKRTKSLPFVSSA